MVRSGSRAIRDVMSEVIVPVGMIILFLLVLKYNSHLVYYWQEQTDFNLRYVAWQTKICLQIRIRLSLYVLFVISLCSTTLVEMTSSTSYIMLLLFLY